eukprot:2488724-Prorocentrum_lima.AAC.1
MLPLQHGDRYRPSEHLAHRSLVIVPPKKEDTTTKKGHGMDKIQDCVGSDTGSQDSTTASSSSPSQAPTGAELRVSPIPPSPKQKKEDQEKQDM